VLAVASLPLGALADLKSRRGVIAWGVGLWSACTALGGLAQRFWQLFVCRALVGVGEAGYAPASQALIAEYFRGRRRAFAIGVYSVGMAFGGVLGIWIGGELEQAYGWRAAFLAMGIPGVVLAVLAAQLRDPSQRPAGTLAGTLRRSVERGVRRAVWYLAPLIGLGLAGAAVGGLLALFEGVPSEVDAAVFGVFAVAGFAWTVGRLVPAAMRRTTEAGEVATNALEDFLEAASVVLRTPTLIWVFVGGALVTFAVNGLIAWAPSFMQRVHGMAVTEVGRTFGVWGLVGGTLGALFGGRLGDGLMRRWAGGRVLVSGAGFVLGGPVCVALLLVNSLGIFVPLLFATFFLYTWYNGPLASVILDVVPPAVRASVLGAFVLFSHLAGDVIALPLVGHLSDQLGGIRRAVLVLPAAGLLGGLVILIAVRTVGRDMQRVRA
jgi:MFS family permease